MVIPKIIQKAVDAYVFEHPAYPVSYEGESEEEVIKGYPKYLREFILHRLDDKLHPLMEGKRVHDGCVGRATF